MAVTRPVRSGGVAPVARIGQQQRRFAQHPHRGPGHRAERGSGVAGDPVGEPAQVVDDPDQRPAARRQPDRAEFPVDVVREQRVHRGVDRAGIGAALQPVGQRGAHPGAVPTQLVVVPRREDEQRGGQADGQRDGPALQPVGDRPDRGADRQHERHQDGPLRGGRRGAQHPGEGDRHAKGEHRRDGKPRVRRHRGAQRDQPGADPAEGQVADRAARPGAGEVHHDEQRDGAEDGVHRGLFRAEGDAERGGHRDHQPGPGGAPAGVVLRIALGQRVEQPADRTRQAHPLNLAPAGRCGSGVDQAGSAPSVTTSGEEGSAQWPPIRSSINRLNIQARSSLWCGRVDCS